MTGGKQELSQSCILFAEFFHLLPFPFSLLHEEPNRGVKKRKRKPCLSFTSYKCVVFCFQRKLTSECNSNLLKLISELKYMFCLSYPDSLRKS